jgi:hypothetical protein
MSKSRHRPPVDALTICLYEGEPWEGIVPGPDLTLSSRDIFSRHSNASFFRINLSHHFSASFFLVILRMRISGDTIWRPGVQSGFGGKRPQGEAKVSLARTNLKFTPPASKSAPLAFP